MEKNSLRAFGAKGYVKKSWFRLRFDFRLRSSRSVAVLTVLVLLAAVVVAMAAMLVLLSCCCCHHCAVVLVRSSSKFGVRFRFRRRCRLSFRVQVQAQVLKQVQLQVECAGSVSGARIREFSSFILLAARAARRKK